MWYTLRMVATSNFLDPQSLTEFAMVQRDKFGLDDSDMISTWYTNDLVNAYRASKTQDELDDERDRQITLYRQRLKGA